VASAGAALLGIVAARFHPPKPRPGTLVGSNTDAFRSPFRIPAMSRDPHQPDLANTPPAAASCDCPRCGYDLSGAVAAWDHDLSTFCPMLGACSECGLEFPWGDVLNPELHVPRWSFEHACSCLPLKFLRTILVALWPFKLWRDLRMAHPVRSRRLLVLVAIGVPLVHVLFIIAPLGTSLLDHAASAASTNAGWADELEIVIQNAWPYSDGLADSLLGVRTSARGLPTVVRPWAAVVWLWWVLMAPMFLFLPTTLRRCRVRRAHLLRVGAYSLVFGAGAVLLLTCATRAITSGLRGLVVWRARLGMGPDAWWLRDISWDLWRWSVWVSPLLCAGTLGGFWGLAASRYLKLPRPWAIAGVLALIAGLTAVLLLSLWPGALTRLYLHAMRMK